VALGLRDVPFSAAGGGRWRASGKHKPGPAQTARSDEDGGRLRVPAEELVGGEGLRALRPGCKGATYGMKTAIYLETPTRWKTILAGD